MGPLVNLRHPSIVDNNVFAPPRRAENPLSLVLHFTARSPSNYKSHRERRLHLLTVASRVLCLAEQ